MKRLLLQKLIKWKSSANRLPIMLDGARQVGKSYLIEVLFGKVHFENVFKLNFEDNPVAKTLFDGSLKPEDILKNISIYYQKDFNPQTDLLFFDEIGLCENALNSLKYFKEQRPDIFLCASGSNIGLIDRYPVGQTYELTLYPMSFHEFVLASNNSQLAQAFENRERSLIVHEYLSDLYKQYLFVGGMPAAVDKWFTSESPIISKSQEVRKIQSDLITGYVRDFGKYSSNSKYLASHLETLFRTVPIQLHKSVDSSVKRFQFSNVIKSKSSYRDFQTLIDYLVSTHLLSKAAIISGEPKQPLSINNTEGRFKLFSHDVGIVHALLNMSYKQVMEQALSYKGYIVENFAQNELLAYGVNPTFSWQSKGIAELEFLVTNIHGDIVPIEIKSGKQTKAKSLESYISKYKPVVAYKLCDLAGGMHDSSLRTRPLYYINHVAESLMNEVEVTNYF